MGTLAQKKFSISIEQKKFLEECKEWGFSDQSTLVREALDRFMKELKTRERKNLMEKKAKELVSDYLKDRELTIFTDLDGEDFL